MKIQVLVGTIASAKSTYSSFAAKNGHIIVSDDSIVNLVHANNYHLYDPCLKLLYKSVENHIASLALALNRVVVVDRGVNLNPHSRKRWISLAHSFDVPCEAVVFEFSIPAVHARRRFKHDNRGHTYDYWYEVALTHHNKYIPPSKEEGFDSVHQISFKEIMEGKVY